MSDMVERAARAICKAHWLNGGDENDDGWDSAPEGLQRNYLVSARAAIEAMREPSQEMLVAGARYYHDNFRPGHEREDTSIPSIWTDMIDTALMSAPPLAVASSPA